MGEHPRNAMKGITLDGDTCTLMVGAQEGGTRIGLLVFLDGEREPEGYDFPFDEAERMHHVLGRAGTADRPRASSLLVEAGMERAPPPAIRQKRQKQA